MQSRSHAYNQYRPPPFRLRERGTPDQRSAGDFLSTPDRISFLAALRWLLAAGTGLPLRRICMLPLRYDRHEPRVQKRQPKNYPLMTKPRAELMQALSGQRLKPYLRPFRGWHLLP